MAKQKEGSLQERIQQFIERQGGYCFKNHGDMTTEPGRPDIVCCYKGLFVGIEVKVDDNEPSRQQGIHCRNIWKSKGIAFITWDLETVKIIFSFINRWTDANCTPQEIQKGVETQMIFANIDDGRRW